MNRRRGWFSKENRIGLRIPEFTLANPKLCSALCSALWTAVFKPLALPPIRQNLCTHRHRTTLHPRDSRHMNPPAANAYQTLRAELIKRISQEHKTRQLLEHEEIGDRKSFQFLRHLRGLAENVGDGVLRTIWLSRLPTYVQPYLVTRANNTIDQLADIADAMEAIRAQLASRKSFPTLLPPPTRKLQIAQMQMQQRELFEQTVTLQKTIETMRLSDHSRGRSPSRSRSMNRVKICTC